MSALSLPGIGVRVEESVLAPEVPAVGVVAVLGAVPLFDTAPVLGTGVVSWGVALVPAEGIVVLFVGAEGFVLGVVSAGIVIVPEGDGRTVGSEVWA